MAVKLIETEAGLPNTCSKCGKPVEGKWFAESVDHARAGLGLCAECANPKPAKKTATKKVKE